MENFSWNSQPDLWKDIPDNILFELSSTLDVNTNQDSSQNWDPLWLHRGESSHLPMTFTPAEISLGKSLEIFNPINLTSSEILPAPSGHESSQETKVEDDYVRKEKKHKTHDGKITPRSSDIVTEGKMEFQLSAKAQELIIVVSNECKTQQLLLEELKLKQAQYTKGTDPAPLITQLKKMDEKINTLVAEIQELHRAIVLTAFELFEIVHLLSVLQQQKAQVALNLRELTVSETENVYHVLISEQPYAPVVFKGRALDVPYSISLLMGPKTAARKAIPIEIHAKVSNQESVKNPVTVDNGIEKYDPAKRHVNFTDIKVSASTRMNPVSIVFTAKDKPRGRGAQGETLAESSPSCPLIVITNESQWCEAAGKLFILELFPGVSNETTWCHFANVLHRQILRATGQDSSTQCNRGFAPWEFNYIHTTHFGGKTIVKKDDVNSFWHWFGHVLTSIRFKRHVKEMWKKGLIFGLISKKGCQDYLSEAEPGCFIIRFSDSSAGSFAIAYTEDKGEKEKVKHYLVKGEDLGTNKTLPDFLKEKSTFKHLGMVNVKEGSLLFADKDTELGLFYGKRKNAEQSSKGYVQNLESEN